MLKPIISKTSLYLKKFFKEIGPNGKPYPIYQQSSKMKKKRLMKIISR